MERCAAFLDTEPEALRGKWREVYPGHEESTSLEFERRFNPYMLHPDRLG